VWEYITKVRSTKEIVMVELRPGTADEKSSYDEFFAYLRKRNR
jgi:hypothetical protein